jgi:hypothetical protein
MGMRFREFLLQEDYADFKQVVTSSFPDCTPTRTNDIVPVPTNSVVCKLAGRRIEVKYYPTYAQLPGKEVVHIQFFGRPMGAEASNKDQPYFTAQALMSGTVEGMHRFIEFARQCKARGWAITYISEGKRLDVYAKAMERAGMRPINKRDNWEAIWV